MKKWAGTREKRKKRRSFKITPWRFVRFIIIIIFLALLFFLFYELCNLKEERDLLRHQIIVLENKAILQQEEAEEYKIILKGQILAAIIEEANLQSKLLQETQHREKAEVALTALQQENPIKKTVIATAYCRENPHGICNDNTPETSTGVIPKEGRTVAVDPKVIPYGSLLWIPDFGWRIAEDTGGAIDGNRIDIFFERYRDAYTFGRQEMTILVFPAIPATD